MFLKHQPTLIHSSNLSALSGFNILTNFLTISKSNISFFLLFLVDLNIFAFVNFSLSLSIKLLWNSNNSSFFEDKIFVSNFLFLIENNFILFIKFNSLKLFNFSTSTINPLFSCDVYIFDTSYDSLFGL